MSSQAPDIPLSKVGPDVWVLADEQGPVNFDGAVVTRSVVGPRPIEAVIVADVPCSVAGLGKVSYDAVEGERVTGWLGYRFRAQWGPGADDVRYFPDTGPRWVLIG